MSGQPNSLVDFLRAFIQETFLQTKVVGDFKCFDTYMQSVFLKLEAITSNLRSIPGDTDYCDIRRGVAALFGTPVAWKCFKGKSDLDITLKAVFTESLGSFFMSKNKKDRLCGWLSKHYSCKPKFRSGDGDSCHDCGKEEEYEEETERAFPSVTIRTIVHSTVRASKCLSELM